MTDWYAKIKYRDQDGKILRWTGVEHDVKEKLTENVAKDVLKKRFANTIKGVEIVQVRITRIRVREISDGE